MAKSARDLAIGYFAKASYSATKNNGEESYKLYQAGAQFLQKAEQFSPDAPDNQALEKIQKDVARGVPGAQQSIQSAVDNQYRSSWDNPFQLKTPEYFKKQ
jgi:hypothetical protein